MIEHAQPDGLHAGGDGHAFVPHQHGQARAIGLATRQHQLGADGRGGERHTPAVGVEHGYSDQQDVPGRQGEGVRLQGAQGVQIVGAMGVEHTLGAACGARGIAKPCRRLLAEPAPGRRDAVRLEQGLMGPHLGPVVLQAVWRPFAVQENDMFERGAKRRQFRQQGRQIGGHGERAVLRLVDHGREMGCGEAWVEGMADQPRAHGRIIDLQMALGVPSQGGDPVAKTQAQGGQGARQAIAARPERGIAKAPHNLPGLRRDDLAISRPLGGMVEELVYCESIGLHVRTGDA